MNITKTIRDCILECEGTRSDMYDAVAKRLNVHRHVAKQLVFRFLYQAPEHILEQTLGMFGGAERMPAKGDRVGHVRHPDAVFLAVGEPNGSSIRVVLIDGKCRLPSGATLSRGATLCLQVKNLHVL